MFHVGSLVPAPVCSAPMVAALRKISRPSKNPSRARNTKLLTVSGAMSSARSIVTLPHDVVIRAT